MLLAFSKDQCYEEVSEINPYFHVHLLSSCPTDYKIVGIVNSDDYLSVLGRTSNGSYVLSVVPPNSPVHSSTQHEKSSDSRASLHSRGAHSFWGLSRGSDFMNAEQFENGWDNNSLQDQLHRVLNADEDVGSEDLIY